MTNSIQSLPEAPQRRSDPRGQLCPYSQERTGCPLGAGKGKGRAVVSEPHPTGLYIKGPQLPASTFHLLKEQTLGQEPPPTCAPA